MSQKTRVPLCVVKESDLTIVEAWLGDKIKSTQIQADRSWTGNNVNYWAAKVLKDAYKRGKIMIRK